MADERDQIAQAMLNAQLERNPALPPESWNRGVRNVTTGVLGGLAEIPQRAMGAAQHYTDTGQYNPEPILNATGVLATGGMPMAAKGAAGMFGGRLSPGADLQALSKAEDMALNRKTAPAIWKETGWVQRPDTNWRYEVSDKGSDFNQTYLNRMRHDDRETMSEVFRHPALYEAMPSLKNIQFGHSAEFPKGALAYYKPAEEKHGILRQAAGLPPKQYPEEIVINAAQSGPQKRESVLHELMHAVQQREGFAQGGAPPDMLKPGTPAFSVYKELKPKLDPEKLQQLSPQQFTKLMTGQDAVLYSPEAISGFIQKVADPKMRDNAAQHFAKQQAYHRLLGESEARLVQRRADMSAEELRANFPSLDVPHRKTIVRMKETDPW
jgi:hypothetical protein